MNSSDKRKSHILQIQDIDKSFPGVHALKSVSLTLSKGQVLALLGENGAGKSTLIKILGGVFKADKGKIVLQGIDTKHHSPKDAQENGISVIYQEFNLIPDLKVYENIFLGKEKKGKFFVEKNAEIQKSLDLFDKIGVTIDPEARCRDLSIAEQQIVEIAKALSVDAGIIIMDEPSAVLTIQEVEQLFKIIKDLKNQGVGIIYVSHRLEEIFEIADSLVVLRDGLKVAETNIKNVNRDKLIELMVGRSIESEFPVRGEKIIGEESIRVENLCGGTTIQNISFTAYKGEVLGFAGLVGAGRTAVMRMIFGADTFDSGKIFLRNEQVTIHEPKDAIDNNICLLTEDRKGQGLVLGHSCQENFGLPNLEQFSSSIFMNAKKEKRAFNHYASKLKIKLSGKDQTAGNLSGGNQQKLVLAKWLAKESDIIIFDEPTRGIDVGAKYEIYELIQRLIKEEKTVLLVSSELEELIQISDRILVMHEGFIKGEIKDVSSVTQKDILSMAIA
ncbi:MAG: sugar ABC transporter ATP-binding protein [Candidatus Neomarinimicrobiota bacterium]